MENVKKLWKEMTVGRKDTVKITIKEMTQRMKEGIRGSMVKKERKEVKRKGWSHVEIKRIN